MQTSALFDTVCLAASIIEVFVLLVYNELCGADVIRVPRTKLLRQQVAMLHPVCYGPRQTLLASQRPPTEAKPITSAQTRFARIRIRAYLGQLVGLH